MSLHHREPIQRSLMKRKTFKWRFNFHSQTPSLVARLFNKSGGKFVRETARKLLLNVCPLLIFNPILLFRRSGLGTLNQ